MTTQPQFNSIRVSNPPLDGNSRTYLTSDVAAAGTSLPVLSTAGAQFLNSGLIDYYVIVGDYDLEKAELTLVDASDDGTTSTAFKTGALVHAHSVSDPVTYIPYNQVKIYGAASSGGDKTLIDTIDIDPTAQYTEYVYTGSDYTYFYTAYFNSTLDTISDYSDEITTTTFSHNSVKRIIQAGLRKALTKIDESEGGVLSLDVAVEVIQDGIDEIINRKRKWPFLNKIDETLETTADTKYLSFPSDLLQLEHVIVDSQPLRWMSKLDYDKYDYATTTTITGIPQAYTIKNNKIYFYPTPSSVLDVTLEYYKNPAVIDSLTDTIDQPFVVMLTYYCASVFAYLRGNDKRGDKMKAQFDSLLEQQVIEYTGPAQVGQAEYVERTSYENDADPEVGSFLGIQ